MQALRHYRFRDPVMKTLPLSLAVVLLAASAAAQTSYTDFLQSFNKVLGSDDEQQIDAAIRGAPNPTLDHVRALCRDEMANPNGPAASKLLVIRGAWQRIYGDDAVVVKLQRFLLDQSPEDADEQRAAELELLTSHYLHGLAMSSTERDAFETACEAAGKAGQTFEKLGDELNAATAWAMVATLNHRIPDRGPPDQMEMIAALQRFVNLRKSWGWVADGFYSQNFVALQNDLPTLPAAEAKAAREDLLVPGVKERVFELRFAMLEDMDPDMFVQGGPLPLLWPEVQLHAQSPAPLSAFKLQNLFVFRRGGNRFFDEVCFACACI